MCCVVCASCVCLFLTAVRHTSILQWIFTNMILNIPTYEYRDTSLYIGTVLYTTINKRFEAEFIQNSSSARSLESCRTCRRKAAQACPGCGKPSLLTILPRPPSTKLLPRSLQPCDPRSCTCLC